MTKRTKTILLILALALVAFSAFHAWWTAPDPELKKDDAPPTPKPGPVTRESLAEQCQNATEKNFPGHNFVEYDPEQNQLTIAVWIDDMDEAAVAAMADTTGTREAWSTLVSDLENACASWQNSYDRAGFSAVTVVMHLLNPSNREKALVSAARGKLIYDIVDGYVKSRDSASEGINQTYVINRKTKVFHLPDCSMTQFISDQNFDYYIGTHDGAIANGYKPCELCDP